MPNDPRTSLAPGSQIDCYRIRRLIGSGGFSLIYLAEDEDLHDEVAIKEYLPRAYAVREAHGQMRALDPTKLTSLHRGRALFHKEASILGALRHPNIVNVRNCLQQNQTSYLVMDYAPGRNLGQYIKQRRGGMSTHFLLHVFPPLLDALAQIHDRGMLHLDIKPANIHLATGRRPLLLDFGAVYRLDEDKSQRRTNVITPGFSPLEQYASAGDIGPWSDIYAVGATMRACVEGVVPLAAAERKIKDTLPPAAVRFRKTHPEPLLQLIDWAMALDRYARPQNAATLRDRLLLLRETITPEETFDETE